MLIINRNKKLKEYQMPKMPYFEYKRLKYVWLRQQKREAELININSIYIQMKDINQMIYSKSMRLVSLYAKYQRCKNNIKHSDEDYILITKSQKGSSGSFNKELIFDIITADWIINLDEIETKSVTELEEELQNLETEIQNLKLRLNNNGLSLVDISNRIKLLEYKKACIDSYIFENVNSNNKVRKLLND